MNKFIKKIDKKHIKTRHVGEEKFGFANILNLQNEISFVGLTFVTVLFSSYIICIDLTRVLTKIKGPNKDNDLNKFDPIFEDFIYALDFIYLCDVSMELILRHLKQPTVHIIIIIVKIISIIPYEIIYKIMGGRNLYVYQGLRTRYFLRIIRYILGIKFKKRSPKSSVVKSIAKGIGIISVLSLFTCCYRIFITCMCFQNMIKGDMNCDDINYKDLILSFTVGLGEIIRVAFNYTGSKFLLVNSSFLPLQISIYIYMFYLNASLICVFIEHQNKKLEYAILSNLILRDLKLIKSNAKENWNHADEMFLTFYKPYLEKYWSLWESQTTHINIEDGLSPTIPEIIENEIKLDVAWNMFKHSVLFRNEELPFLRFLAKSTRYKYLPAGYRIWSRMEFKTKMIYIVSGCVQVISKDNEETPLIVFSGGTCLGEISMFLSTPSKVTMICQSYTEIVELDRISIVKAKKVFPKVYSQLKQNINSRIGNAKVFDSIGKHLENTPNVGIPKKELSLRYVKNTLRKYLGHKHEKINSILQFNQLYDKSLMNESVFCTDYIPMYVLTNQTGTNTKFNFVKTGVAFKLRSGSELIKFWKLVVNILSIFLGFIYPIAAVLEEGNQSTIFYIFMEIITVMWILDFFSFLFIAIEDKDKLYADAISLSHYHINKADFWMDFWAALPMDEIVEIMEGPITPSMRTFLQINRLLKIVKFLRSLEDRRFNDTFTWLIAISLETLFAVIVLILFFYYIFNFRGLYRFLSIISPSPWISTCEKLVVVFGFFFCIPLSIIMISATSHLTISLIFLQFLCALSKLFLFPRTTAVFGFHYSITVEYKNLVEDMRKVMLLFNCETKTRNKIVHYLRIHYEETKGKLLMKRSNLKLFLGYNIRRIVQTIAYSPLFRKIPLFSGLPNKVIADFCEICDVIYIPEGEILVYAGMGATSAYLLIRGVCGIVDHNCDVKKVLYPGEYLLIPEVLCRSRVVHNIMAITDCSLLHMSQDLLEETLIKHSSLNFEIKYALEKTINKENLEKWAEYEIMSRRELITSDYVKKKSFLFFKADTFNRDFGKSKWFKKLIIRFAIRPNGKFWLYWEVFHFCLVYIDAFFSSIPITINGDPHSAYFWVYRLIDAVRIVDIFLRHYLIYYNKYNLEISHPKKTIVHYWKSSFILDLISALPFDVFKNIFIKRTQVKWLLLLRANRYLQLYRYFGIQKYIKKTFMGDQRLFLLSSYACFMLILFNILSFLILFPNCTILFLSERIICKTGVVKNFWSFYLRIYKNVLKSAFNIGMVDERILLDLRIKSGINAFIGFLLTLYFTNVIVALGLNRNAHLTVFQVNMRGLINFMNLQKIDKKLRAEVIKHYEHLWFLQEGTSIKHALKLFNKACYTEVVYSLYGSILHTSILFDGFSKVLLRDYLSNREIVREIYLIKGIIIKVNDVQSNMFLIIKGSVDVLGPDFSKHVVLGVGSMFGCLDKVAKQRSTLNYVAKTHCELITITSREFHKFLQKHPSFKSHYMRLLKNSNFDYINSTLNSKTVLAPILKSPSGYGNTHTKLLKFCRRIFMVRKPNAKLDLFFAIINVLSYLIECFQKVTISESIILVVMLYILDCIYLLKIYTHFSTTYENELGLQERRRKKIAIKYLKNPQGFAFDVFCVFPFDIIGIPLNSWVAWTYCRLNRLPKILLVFKYLQSMRNRLNINIFLIKSAHILLTYLFVQQILMIVLVHVEMIPKIYTTSIDIYYQALSVHTSLQIGAIFYLFENQNNPRRFSKSYSAAFIFIITISRFLDIYFMAEFVSCFQILNFTNFRFQRFYRNLKSSMQNMGVSLPLSKRILSYYEKLAKNEQTVQFPSFLKEAPYYLSEGIMESLFGYHLRNHPVFKQCHKDLLRQLSANFETLFFYPGNFVAFQGDLDSNMYFVHQGEVEGLSVDALSYEVSDVVYKDGDYFGFTQMMYEDKGHVYSYKITKKSIILVLRRAILLGFLDFFPASKHVIFNENIKDD